MRQKPGGNPAWTGVNTLAAVLFCALVLGTCGLSPANNRSQPQPAWTRYVNARWGFCVEYPTQWRAIPLSDGSGVTLYPRPSSDPASGPYLSISGLPDQPDIDNANIVLDDSPPPDLEGNFARSLENLRQYDHASEIRVLSKRKLGFQGYPALRTKFQYRTGTDEAPWAEETLWINKEYTIFTATLFGHQDELRRLNPVYEEILRHRFHLVCAANK